MDGEHGDFDVYVSPGRVDYKACHKGAKEADAKAGHRADEYRTSTQNSLSPSQVHAYAHAHVHAHALAYRTHLDAVLAPPPSQTDALVGLSRRVQLLTRLPISHVEQIQVLRYQPSQH